MPENATHVSREVVGLVALDFILWVVFLLAMHMALVVEVPGVNGDDRSRDPAGLGIPADMIADLESSGHPDLVSRKRHAARWHYYAPRRAPSLTRRARENSCSP